MKTSFDNNLSFGRLIFSRNAQKLLYQKRLKTGADHVEYLKLLQSQYTNPHNILISTTNDTMRFVAQIKLSNKTISKPIKENYIRALFNMSPFNYLKKLCKKADKLRSSGVIKETA